MNINSFSYYCPTKLVFGPEQTQNTGSYVAELGLKHVLLVSGSGATKKSAGIELVKKSLAEAGVKYELFDKVKPDPSAEQVAEAVEAMHSAQVEGLVAFGGGSPIDCAKSAALSYTNKMPILDIIYGKLVPNKPALPIVAIPTTAGTGSEMSAAAVTTDRALGRKTGYTHESFFPKIAIVDPNNHITMPPHITAATGMDALTHAIESYLSLGANPLSDAINIKAAAMIGAYLPMAYKNGSDLLARAVMALASAQAGSSISQTGLGMVHGFAHPIGAKFALAHGEANAILLPYILAALVKNASAKMYELALALGACKNGIPAEHGAKDLVEYIVWLKKKLNIHNSLEEAGIHIKDAKDILPDALTYRSRPKSPRPFTDNELSDVLNAAIVGDISLAYKA